MISSSCRKLSGYRRYHRTHRTMISASKCRPLNSAGRFRLMQAEAYQTGRTPLQHILLEKVKHLGLDNDTLVLFLSDNGPWFGGSTAGLRGMKVATWDGGIRVPLIARWPGRIPAGRVNREVCSSVDLFPTLCALAGAKPPAQTKIDGLDIFPLMTSDTAKSPHEAIFAMSGPELHVVRSGKWKLHVRVPAPGFQRLDDAAAAKWVDPRGPDGVTLIAQFEQARPNQYPGAMAGDAPKPMMLFDMEADPAETRDISADHPDVVQRLEELFEKVNAEALRPDAGATRSGRCAQVDRWPVCDTIVYQSRDRWRENSNVTHYPANCPVRIERPRAGGKWDYRRNCY